MGDCEVLNKELRFIFEENETHVYAYIIAIGDCPITTQGVYFKAFPKEISVLQILHLMGKGEEKIFDWVQRPFPN